ncbi:tyrosine-type recombinase/integrase [Cytobacillus oceanisediminis]|uniref:tyrosine-type recombinase/integrase n=1 Tax=Cytobacillus oceanisediminis TaxID=665099 RepID=UPI00254CB24E|nr:tyrosine-type recombinase/integrase [Cytobacillus oceanisediminis]MDK7669182.1 tyrosine-type recombinase/integrase [Cytobacillus oceanisediminis]
MNTSEECIQRFKDDYCFRLTPESIDFYEISLRQLLMYSGKPLLDITKQDIQNWVIYLDEIGNKPATAKTKIAGLKRFYKYLLEEGVISYNPMEKIPFPQVEDKLPCYLRNDQLSQLREVADGEMRERAIIELLYSAGIRLKELAAMKKEDINWTERIIHIPRGKRKKARIVLFTRTCAEYLKSYLEERKDDLPFVFVNRYGTRPICTRTIQINFKKYKTRLGFHLTPHTLRHTFAAHLAIKGMPLEGIQDLLGHDGPQQAQLYARLYSHARKSMYDEWM